MSTDCSNLTPGSTPTSSGTSRLCLEPRCTDSSPKMKSSERWAATSFRWTARTRRMRRRFTTTTVPSRWKLTRCTCRSVPRCVCILFSSHHQIHIIYWVDKESLLLFTELRSFTHTLSELFRSTHILIFLAQRTVWRCLMPCVSVWSRNKCCRGCTTDWTSVRWGTRCPQPCSITSRRSGSPSCRLPSPSRAPPSTAYWASGGCSAPAPSQTASICFRCSTRAGASGGRSLQLTPPECPTRASLCSTTLFILSEETRTPMDSVQRLAAGGKIVFILFKRRSLKIGSLIKERHQSVEWFKQRHCFYTTSDVSLVFLCCTSFFSLLMQMYLQ